MFVNLMRITSPLRSNLLQRLPHTKENVRCYGIFRSLGNNSRCQGVLNKLKPSRITSLTSKVIRNFADESFTNINTNVANNVILWKFEHPKYFFRMGIFNVVQFVILITFSYVSWTFIPIMRHDMAWKEYIKLAYLPATLCFFSAVAAISTSCLMWYFTCRSLKYIILNKGGTTATLVTYHPTKGSTPRVVPLEDIMVKRDRNDVGTFISLRIKNTSFFHLLDKDGIFVNPDLYDQSVGLDRTPKPRKKKDPDSVLG